MTRRRDASRATCCSPATPTRPTSWATAARTARRRCCAPTSCAEIARRARQFDGAWAYLESIARAAGIADPLDERVVEAYWIGNDLLDRVDPGTRC